MNKCKKCNNTGMIVDKKGNMIYCDCAKGKRLKMIDKKRSQKGFGDNY